ncbi:MAG TPA: hypothetical protein VK674_02840 [Candidatus Limnocylindria bacterium]|nr:hypothetical protein [Candidatus Limnocylindria bacterium]
MGIPELDGKYLARLDTPETFSDTLVKVDRVAVDALDHIGFTYNLAAKGLLAFGYPEEDEPGSMVAQPWLIAPGKAVDPGHLPQDFTRAANDADFLAPVGVPFGYHPAYSAGDAWPVHVVPQDHSDTVVLWPTAFAGDAKENQVESLRTLTKDGIHVVIMPALGAADNSKLMKIEKGQIAEVSELRHHLPLKDQNIV